MCFGNLNDNHETYLRLRVPRLPSIIASVLAFYMLQFARGLHETLH